MDSDLPLPSPPRNRARDTRIPTSTAPDARKPSFSASTTQRLNSERLSGTPSSDPPLFSSDDFQSSALENYSYTPSRTNNGCPAQARPPQQSRKRRYRGTWWGEHLHAKKKRTEFGDKRQFDSGVWMGSEDSTDNPPASSDDVLWLAAEARDNDLHYRGHERQAGNAAANNTGVLPQPLSNGETLPTRVEKLVESEPHRRARCVIVRCLEDGNDNVDLSYFNMETIPPGLLRPLVQITKEPAINEPPQGEGLYSSLEPFLQLFLTRNLLTSVPTEVLGLGSLRVLSLRHNKITEIPSSIRNLTMLQDLNVAGNRLQHLPWELLRLMQVGGLRRLTVHPNPFIKLDEQDIAQWHCHQIEQEDDDGDVPADATERLRADTYQDEIPPGVWAPAHVATGKVRYMDMEGRPTQCPNPWQQHTTSEVNLAGSSLRELSLRACTRSTHLSLFFDPEDTEDLASYPDTVFRLLSEAKRVKDAGGQVCSMCSTSFVIPRTEWVEWWDCIPIENGLKGARKSGQDLYPLPFLRRGCSWACCPRS